MHIHTSTHTYTHKQICYYTSKLFIPGPNMGLNMIWVAGRPLPPDVNWMNLTASAEVTL